MTVVEARANIYHYIALCLKFPNLLVCRPKFSCRCLFYGPECENSVIFLTSMVFTKLDLTSRRFIVFERNFARLLQISRAYFTYQIHCSIPANFFRILVIMQKFDYFFHFYRLTFSKKHVLKLIFWRIFKSNYSLLYM